MTAVPIKEPPSPVILLVSLQRGDMAFVRHVGLDLIALCHSVELGALVHIHLVLHPIVILDRVELAALFIKVPLIASLVIRSPRVGEASLSFMGSAARTMPMLKPCLDREDTQKSILAVVDSAPWNRLD